MHFLGRLLYRTLYIWTEHSHVREVRLRITHGVLEALIFHDEKRAQDNRFPEGTDQPCPHMEYGDGAGFSDD